MKPFILIALALSTLTTLPAFADTNTLTAVCNLTGPPKPGAASTTQVFYIDLEQVPNPILPAEPNYEAHIIHTFKERGVTLNFSAVRTFSKVAWDVIYGIAYTLTFTNGRKIQSAKTDYSKNLLISSPTNAPQQLLCRFRYNLHI